MAGPIDHGRAIGIALTVVVTAAWVFGDRRRLAALALAHVLALGAWVVVDHGAGSPPTTIGCGAAPRAASATATARSAPTARCSRSRPTMPNAHYHLGTLLLARDAADEALGHLHRAEQLEPSHARAFVAEARWLASHGKQRRGRRQGPRPVHRPSRATATRAPWSTRSPARPHHDPAGRDDPAPRSSRRRRRACDDVCRAPRCADGCGGRAGRAARITTILDELFPAPAIPLDHEDPFQLLVATILSAQCTDARVNMVTPALFARAPDAATMAS